MSPTFPVISWYKTRVNATQYASDWDFGLFLQVMSQVKHIIFPAWIYAKEGSGWSFILLFFFFIYMGGLFITSLVVQLC